MCLLVDDSLIQSIVFSLRIPTALLSPTRFLEKQHKSNNVGAKENGACLSVGAVQLGSYTYPCWLRLSRYMCPGQQSYASDLFSAAPVLEE
jgi:hypothetical protein